MKLISKYEVNILSDIDIFTVKFPGPENTSYEGGTWKIRVFLPEKYPYQAPKIGFINKVFHPNIDEGSGVVCLNVIDESWSALYDLREVFKNINISKCFTLNCDVPLCSFWNHLVWF